MPLYCVLFSRLNVCTNCLCTHRFYSFFLASIWILVRMHMILWSGEHTIQPLLLLNRNACVFCHAADQTACIFSFSVISLSLRLRDAPHLPAHRAAAPERP